MYELHLERLIATSEVREAVATAFNIPHDQVIIAEDLETAIRPPGAGLLCTVHVGTGEFPTHLTILSYGLRYTSRHDLPTEVQVARVISRSLSCRCLISDELINPFSWLLITPDAELRRVSVNTEALDRNELVIDSEINDAG